MFGAEILAKRNIKHVSEFTLVMENINVIDYIVSVYCMIQHILYLMHSLTGIIIILLLNR